MRERESIFVEKIRTAFTFDHHFATVGFHLVG